MQNYGKLRKFGISFVIITVMILSITVQAAPMNANNNSSSALPDVIKIGLLAPFSGQLGFLGNSTTQGVYLAEHIINDIWGGIERDGLANATVEIIQKDTEGSSTTAVAEAEKLINDDKVEVIIGPLLSSNTLAVSNITNPAKVVIISYASTSPRLTTEGGDYTFRVCPSDSLGGWALADISLALGFEKVVTVTVNDTYGDGILEVYWSYFTGSGNEVVKEIKADSEETDYSDILAEIKDLEDDDKIDGVLAVIFPAQMADFLGEAYSEGVAQDMTWVLGEAGTAIITSEYIGKSTDFDNALTVMDLVSFEAHEDPSSTEFQAYNDSFYDFYPSDKEFGGTSGYDALMLAIDAIIEADAYDGEAIKNVLPTVSQGWIGVTGDKTFDENGDVGSLFDVAQVSGATVVANIEYDLIGTWTRKDGASFTHEGSTKTYHATSQATREKETSEAGGASGFLLIPIIFSFSISLPFLRRRRKK